ncbi:MAG: type III pantothenate kinase [Coriobacteriales bacterium]|jgi:type III pantothenate kinase|nr:type III pantothenate kinase [Coriobacteriales bacterium]
MLLAVDIGNTQTVLGLYEGDTFLARWRVATIATGTSDELVVHIRALLALKGFKDAPITNMAIASVVPSLTEQWRLVASRLAIDEPFVLNGSIDIGLPINYANPAEIGADRLADAVAAVALYGAPVVVVDFGTATNIEVVDKNGAFVGGVIAPGLVTSAEALFNAAARLAKTSIEVPPAVIGTTTREAVQSGLTYGEIDRVDGLISRIIAELGYPVTVVATGGLSARVVGLSQTINVINDDLTLEGLRIIYQRNRKMRQ